MNTEDFNKQLQYGQDGEREIAARLISNGFAVMPLYQFSASFAPTIYSNNGNYTCPDLMCFSASYQMFVDSKKKRQWVTYSGGKETGINKNHYEAYKKLSDTTGIDMYLVFIHDENEPMGIYITEIHNEHTRSWDGYYNGNYRCKPMVFFTSESLRRIK